MGNTPLQGILIPGTGPKGQKRRAPARRANDLDGRTWLRNSISIWNDIAKTPEERALKHPAMFPEQLARRLIESLTNSAQTVILDPFSGIGSTVLAAEAAGKLGIGLDLSASYLLTAARRPPRSPSLLEEEHPSPAGRRRFLNADARDLLEYVAHESVDLVVTSPPYWDILRQDRSADYRETRNYGDDRLDLGATATYEEFLGGLEDVFAQVLRALRPSSYCCVVVMDLRKKDRFFPLHSDLAARMQQIGFVLDDLIIWDRRREYNNLRPLGYPSVFRINKVHEYIMIFQKPQA